MRSGSTAAASRLARIGGFEVGNCIFTASLCVVEQPEATSMKSMFLITAAGLFLAAAPYAYALDITSEPDATITQQ
jgi:hypothetical protein